MGAAAFGSRPPFSSYSLWSICGLYCRLYMAYVQLMYGPYMAYVWPTYGHMRVWWSVQHWPYMAMSGAGDLWPWSVGPYERLPERSVKARRLSRTFGPNHCEKYGGTIRRAQNHYEKYGEKIGMLPNHYKNHQNIGPKCGICSKSHKM